MKLIAVRSPAAIEADLIKRGGDIEKVATAQSYYARVKGVLIHSRYGKAEELELLAEWAWAIEPWQRSLIKMAWCDSKAQWTFDIQFLLNPTEERFMDYHEIGSVLADVCKRRVGGFNQIYCTWKGEDVTNFSAWWREDD